MTQSLRSMSEFLDTNSGDECVEGAMGLIDAIEGDNGDSRRSAGGDEGWGVLRGIGGLEDCSKRLILDCSVAEGMIIKRCAAGESSE